MAVKIIIDNSKIAKLTKASNQAFAATVEVFAEQCISVIEDSQEFADIGLSDRDIVDTGRLRDSMQIFAIEYPKKTRATISWNPQDPDSGRFYAADVFTGAGRLPGRNWPERALRREQWENLFCAKLLERLNNF